MRGEWRAISLRYWQQDRGGCIYFALCRSACWKRLVRWPIYYLVYGHLNSTLRGSIMCMSIADLWLCQSCVTLSQRLELVFSQSIFSNRGLVLYLREVQFTDTLLHKHWASAQPIIWQIIQQHTHFLGLAFILSSRKRLTTRV